MNDNFVTVLSHEVIPCDGNVTTWNLWTRQSGKLRAMIVRPVPTCSNTIKTAFTIVGINDITITSAMANQNITYTVPSDERIIAQNGDMIAVAAFENNPGLHAIFQGGEGIVCKYEAIDTITLNPGMIFHTDRTTEATFSLSVATSTE